MKLFTTVATLLVISFLSTSTIIAQEVTQSPTPTKRTEAGMKKEEIMNKRNEVEKRVAQNRLEIKERISSKSAAFKAKLQTLKDAKKKEVVERVQVRLTDINENRTQHYTKVLARLTVILERMKERRPEADITEAEEAIATAQAAVDAQGIKEYIPTITTESTLRLTVGQSMSQLQKDLQETKTLVQEAKKAVMDVAKAQKEEKAEENDEEDKASTSGEVEE